MMDTSVEGAMVDFRDKAAVVTGAASGMRVVLADVEGRALAQAEAELRGPEQISPMPLTT